MSEPFPWLRRLVEPPWWVWPSLLVLLAGSSMVCALLLEPRPDELCYLLGHPFGGECGFTVLTGWPCPQCGMTRSFVWGVRGHLIKAWFYNPAGIALFLWIQAGGLVGAARLISRDADRWTPPWPVLFGWTLTWLIGLYTVPWVLRIAVGVNPLP